MELSERNKNILTRIFIALILCVIVAIYYLSELKPFDYQGYESNINQLQRYNAELNASIVQTRFGSLKDYAGIDNAIQHMHQTLDEFKVKLQQHPNSTISEKLQILEKTFDAKENYTQAFKQLNPVFIQSIQSFSDTLEPIIDSEQNTQLIEGCTIGDYKPILLDKANDLFRGILIYVNQASDEKHNELIKLVQDIRTAPQKLTGMDEVLSFSDKILELQPKLTEIDLQLFQFPIPNLINALHGSFFHAEEIYEKRINMYHIVLYILSFILIVVLRWAFNRLAESNRQLEQRVADRTHELTIKNKDLHQALSDLKEAQDQLVMQEKMASVGMLTTGIAHEIKNPLNFVNNFSDISIDLVSDLKQELEANKEKFAPDTLQNIEELILDLKTNCSKIKEHGVRADNIVKTMLLHSQEAGLEKEMIILNNLLSDNIQVALESFNSTHGKFDVKLDKIFDPNIDRVLAAPQTLGRVFIYIIDNALYALKEKQQQSPPDFQPTLTITTQLEDEKVIIKIRDNGNGIPAKNLNKVFEPFFTTKPTGRGNTGLGLSICYDTVVKQHKGDLRVSSEEGIFTEFTVVLPIGTKKPQE